MAESHSVSRRSFWDCSQTQLLGHSWVLLVCLGKSSPGCYPSTMATGSSCGGPSTAMSFLCRLPLSFPNGAVAPSPVCWQLPLSDLLRKISSLHCGLRQDIISSSSPQKGSAFMLGRVLPVLGLTKTKTLQQRNTTCEICTCVQSLQWTSVIKQ